MVKFVKADDYMILGLEIGMKLSIDEIKKAYKRKALELHPDKRPRNDRSSATVKFQKLQSAYENLLNAAAIQEVQFERNFRPKKRKDHRDDDHHHHADGDYHDGNYGYDHDHHGGDGAGKYGYYAYDDDDDDDDEYKRYYVSAGILGNGNRIRNRNGNRHHRRWNDVVWIRRR